LLVDARSCWEAHRRDADQTPFKKSRWRANQSDRESYKWWELFSSSIEYHWFWIQGLFPLK
jgi:hypothetical protein